MVAQSSAGLLGSIADMVGTGCAEPKWPKRSFPPCNKAYKDRNHPLPQDRDTAGTRCSGGVGREDLWSGTRGPAEIGPKAHPGRAVLVGGTSDRDILMDAINNWGVIRVVPTDADPQTIVDAIQAAGAYLNREVAMETAIDDLDIETTMLDSAIDQIHGNRDQDRHIDRSYQCGQHLQPD